MKHADLHGMLLRASDHPHEGFLLNQLACQVQVQGMLLVQGLTLLKRSANLMRHLWQHLL